MTEELLTLVADPTWATGGGVLLYGGGTGLLAAFGIVLKWGDKIQTARGVAVTMAGIIGGVATFLCGALISSDMMPNGDDRVRWQTETATWLEEEHGLTLEEGDQEINLKSLLRGGQFLGVDSEGERHSVELVRYEGTLPDGDEPEGRTFYLEDVETGEPFVADETVEEETDGEG